MLNEILSKSNKNESLLFQKCPIVASYQYRCIQLFLPPEQSRYTLAFHHLTFKSSRFYFFSHYFDSLIIKFQQHTVHHSYRHNFSQTYFTQLVYFPVNDLTQPRRTSQYYQPRRSTVSHELRHTFIQKLVPCDKMRMLLCGGTTFTTPLLKLKTYYFFFIRYLISQRLTVLRLLRRC